MRIPLFVHVAIGVVIAGLVLRAVESGVFSLSSSAPDNVAINQIPNPVS